MQKCTKKTIMRFITCSLLTLKWTDRAVCHSLEGSRVILQFWMSVILYEWDTDVANLSSIICANVWKCTNFFMPQTFAG